ncbi:MAG: 4,5-DOPA dioxygenase extradiol [Chloroflexota bacterium]
MTEKMPVLFVGHGSPMNAIEENEFALAWTRAGEQLPRPKVILAVSAHWETIGTKVTAMEKPRTIYDFYGFPQELYEMSYPAPGKPDLVQTIRKLIQKTEIQPDMDWGLDHGTWSVLARLYPKADIPVVQISLDRSKSPKDHYQLGEQLKELREEGVLIISSGNIVHNLRMVKFDDSLKFGWAEDFDKQVKELILSGDHDPLIQYEKLGQAAQLSINSAEHYIPLLYTLGLKNDDDAISFFADRVTYGSLSMRSVRFG